MKTGSLTKPEFILLTQDAEMCTFVFGDSAYVLRQENL